MHLLGSVLSIFLFSYKLASDTEKGESIEVSEIAWFSLLFSWIAFACGLGIYFGFKDGED